MAPPLHLRSPRGAALPVALILLAVLTAIAVAAVSLSGQERVNAASYSKLDFVNQCANAAQAKIWAEMAYQGSAYLSAPTAVTYVKLPGDTRLVSPAHYDWDKSVTAPLVKDVVLKVQSSAGTGGDVNERDCTNSTCGLTPLGGTQMIMAHCVDATGHALEIELGIRFAL